MATSVVARRVRAAVVLAALACGVEANAQTPPEPSRSSSLAPLAAEDGARRAALAAARKQADQDGQARIIVQLDPAVALSTMAPDAATPAARRATAVRTTRDALLARLAGTRVGALKSFQALPMMAMEAGADALDVLAHDPTVSAIQVDRKNRPSLVQSLGVIDADLVHARGNLGEGAVVAVLDTGIDRFHPFFQGRVVAEACFSTTTRFTDSVCPRGRQAAFGPGAAAPCLAFGCDHGTHVAGIAAGASAGRRGVAPAVEIVAVQVFSEEFVDCGGEPVPCPVAFDSDILAGLDHVLALSDEFDFAAVNLSLGAEPFFGACDAFLLPYRAMFDALRERGIAPVVASGNDGLNGAAGAPACVSSAISVGSTTKTDRVSFFSNHAATVDLLAPGSRITSSIPGGGFIAMDGTSMAAPHVAGAVALLESAHPEATVDEIERALVSTGRPLQRAGIRRPRIDVDAALAALDRQDQPTPANDLLANAEPLAGMAGSARGTNVNATSEAGEPVHVRVGGGASVWWTWRPPVSGPAIISTEGSNFDTVLALYRGNQVGQLVKLVSNNNRRGISPQSAVVFRANSARTYRIVVDGVRGATGDITLSYSVTDPALAGTDQFGVAPEVAVASGTMFGSTVGATRQPNEPVHAGVGGGQSIWWRWRAPAGGLVTFSTAGSSFDTVLAVYQGRRLTTLREVASNDDINGAMHSEVTFNAQAGAVYRIAVDGYREAAGDVVLSFGRPNETTPTLASR